MLLSHLSFEIEFAKVIDIFLRF